MTGRINQYIWNALFALLYIWLVVMGVQYLEGQTYIGAGALSPFDLVLLSLATFRLTRLFVYDAVTKFVRELFFNITELGGEAVVMKPESGPRRVLAELFSCPWCFGLWAATVVTFAYLATPYAYIAVAILAIAGVGTLVQLFANFLGWSAELKKHSATHTR